MAKEQESPATPIKDRMFVAGYGSADKGQIFLTIKDRIARNPLLRVKCSKVATLWLPKGVTLEEAKQNFPLGTEVTNDIELGEERSNSFGVSIRVANAIAQ